jgi:UDP-glucose 4-epimerase
VQGVRTEKDGIYNLAGDGVITLREIAKVLKKPYVGIPSSVMESALGILQKLNLSQYGPEQVRFLKYRPVLANDKLKNDFGYTPQKTSKEAFDYYRETHA